MLPPKQQAFAREYLVDLNPAAAYRRAGYTVKNDNVAHVEGHRVLRNPKVQELIQAGMDKRAQKTGVTADLILGELLKLASVDLSQAYDKDGKLLPIHDIPADVRKAISSVEVFEEFEGFGEMRAKTGETRKVKFYDKTKALELLGKHLKLFVDKIEVEATGELAQRLAQAQARLQGKS